MSLMGRIYELCNRGQCPGMDSVDFFQALNPHKNSHPLQINSGEKVYVCYLISKPYILIYGTKSKRPYPAT